MNRTFTVQQVAARAQEQKPRFNVPWRPFLQEWAGLYAAAVVGCDLADPCMLAAIVNRESGGRNILQEGVPPGDGCGVGLCQITSGVSWADLSAPAYPGYGPLLTPIINLKVAAHLFLEPALEAFPDDHRAAFAAYNLGIDGVTQEIVEGRSPDAWTTGNNYGISVFTNWINFAAVSMGVDVSWSSYQA